jgi:nitroreductase
MADPRVAPLIHTRQIRDFTDEPIDDAELNALTDVARWSGSSTNSQPWRFIAIRDTTTLRRIAGLGVPTRRPRSTAGKARLPRDEVVFAERWPEA